MHMMDRILKSAKDLAFEMDGLTFSDPVHTIYNPLQYAWQAHEEYLRMWPERAAVLFLGMNPGPWGMAQTGVPFGEVGMVRDWLGIKAGVGQPKSPHPKRPVQGWDCPRSEVSGRRLWGLFRERYGKAVHFFRENLVHNYCPLLFLKASGANLTPDKLPAGERGPLEAACDRHLRVIVEILRPEHLVGVGAYAERCLRRLFPDRGVIRILHPSPASPAANHDWAGNVSQTLCEKSVWPENLLDSSKNFMARSSAFFLE